MTNYRILDAAVDQFVFGRVRFVGNRTDLEGCPRYTEDQAASDKLAAALKERGFKMRETDTQVGTLYRYECSVWGPGAILASPRLSTPAIARAYAAITALGELQYLTKYGMYLRDDDAVD